MHIKNISCGHQNREKLQDNTCSSTWRSEYDPRRDDTATKIVVTQEEIARYGDTSVVDVLKRVPGITVSSPNGRGGQTRMRGLGAGYTQILINGERAPGGFTIDSLSPDVIERIEVLRAASANSRSAPAPAAASMARRPTCNCPTNWAGCRIRSPPA
jgi:outer membrane receptor for ferrienterochelin and colicin